MTHGISVAELPKLPGINYFGVYFANPEPSARAREEASAAGQTHFQAILGHIDAAARQAIQLVKDDRSRQRRYEFCSPLKGFGGPSVVEQVSVFADSGLPRVEKLGTFMQLVAEQFAASGTLPFLEVSMPTLKTLWPLLTSNPRRKEMRESCENLCRYLARMEWRDTEEWKGAESRRWVENLQNPLVFYLMELFADRFVDRNGVKVDFSLGIKPTTLSALSNLQLSPELAGKIISVLVEFLGDVVFRVPYYSDAVLKVYESGRQNSKALTSNGSLSAKLRAAVETGQLTSSVADELAIPGGDADPVELDWSLLRRTNSTDPKDTSTIVGSQTCRFLDSRVRELDAEFRTLKERDAVLRKKLGEIKNNTSTLQTAFTIHAAGIQTEFIKCQRLPEYVPNCDESVIGSDEKDYAGLVGKLVALAAKTAATNVRAVVGGAVRGVSLLSLDNEVVAEVAASAAATAAKKVAEYVTYTILGSYIKDLSIPPATRRETLEALRSIHERLEEPVPKAIA